MAHEDTMTMSSNTEQKLDQVNEEQKCVQQQLIDANKQIEELKMQIAWLERSYE